MTGYFFHCQHKCRTHEKRKNSQQIAEGWKRTLCTRCWRFYWCRHHQRFVYLDWRVFPPPLLRFIFSRYSFFSSIRAFAKQLVGVAYFFYSHYSFFLYFFRACCLHTFLRTIARDLFVPFIFSRILPPKYEDCFSVKYLHFFVLRSACSIPVLHLIHTVSCCVFYLCLCGSFPSFISLLLCFDAEISCAVFTDGVSWFRLRIILSSVCLLNNKICCRALILRQSCRCQKAFNASHATAAGLKVKRIINVFTDDFLFFSDSGKPTKTE